MDTRSPIQYDIVHTTTYRYKQPVRFGEHRVMFRPRDSHDQRVLATDLAVSPEADIRLIQDPHSNSVALVQPVEPADELKIVCSFTIEHAYSHNLALPMSPEAELFPFAYGVDERFDLEAYLRPHHEDPGGKLTAWARQFLRSDGPTRTRDMLVEMNQFIRDHFHYESRDEEGTQPPAVTLERGGGSCRDFALLMMEAARRLGVATRFVSGYLYDPALDAPEPAVAGADALAALAAAGGVGAEGAMAVAVAGAVGAAGGVDAVGAGGVGAAGAGGGVGGEAGGDGAPVAMPKAAPAIVGAGYTHAWLQAYLPGAGWVPFDPTNNLLGGTQLIRVGVARHPAQAAPVRGSWFGDKDDYLGMTVSVTVKRR